jgi:hypothetical protein
MHLGQIYFVLLMLLCLMWSSVSMVSLSVIAIATRWWDKGSCFNPRYVCIW